MVAVAKVTIAGEPILGDEYGSHSWVDRLGIQAVEVIWALPPALAAKVLKLKETEITITPPGGQTTTYKRVVVVKEEATDDPLRRYVKLSNVLWYLPRLNVRRDFNVRSRTGATRILTIPGAPIEVDPIVKITTYQPYSLKNGTTPNSADDILVWVENYIVKNADAPTPLAFKTSGRSRGQYTPNDVMLDGPSNIALGHALGLAGGLDVHVTPEGVIELVDAFMGAEIKTIETTCTYALEQHGGPLRKIDMGHVAPKIVNGLYQRECEVRGDAWEKAPTEAALTDAEIGNRPVFRNVIKVTDLTLPYQGTQFVAGTYLDVDTWFAAVAAKGDGPTGVALPFTRQNFLDNYLGGGRLYNIFAIDITGAQPPNQLWMSRIGAGYEGLRLTYQLNPAFANLCVPGTIKAVRAALLDPTNGIRQPSPAYLDFCRKPTLQGMQNEKYRGWNTHSILPVESEPIPITKTYTETWPDQPFTLASAVQAPFSVALVDDVVGIFQLQPRKDPWGNVAEVIQCLVFDVPSIDVVEVATKGLNAFWEDAKLLYTHRMALVFTATPGAAPLHRYPVTAAAALQKLGVPANAVSAQGPAFDIRIGPGLATARIAWDDNDRTNLLKLFTDPDQAESVGQSLTPVNNAELQDYATSAAAVLMAALLDHYEGHADIAFTPSLSPLGALRSVTHTVTADGELYTTVDCAAVTPAVNPIHLLDASSRQILLRSPSTTP